MHKTQCKQIENQNRFLRSELQAQLTASSHTHRDHLLKDPVKVTAAVYTKDDK